LALGVVFFAAIYVIRIRSDMVDFEVNYRAGGRLLAGEDLYRVEDGHFMFKYFPFAAMLYAPLSLLPLPVAKAVWFAVTAVCTVAIFVVSKRLVSGRAFRPAAVVALPPVVLAKFCLRELKLGQINALVTLVLLFMTAALVHDRRRAGERAAGALWGLATAIKPYGFIFFPYFVVKGAWWSLLTGAAVLAAGALLPALFYGLRGDLEAHRDWFVTLSQSTPAQLGVNDNVSVFGLFAKWLGRPELARELALVVVGLLAVAVLLTIRRGRSLPRAPLLECGLLLALIPLVSPLGWDYQLLTSVLAVSLLAEHWRELALSHRWFLGANLAVAAFSIYDVIGRAAYGRFMHWSVLTVNFLVVTGYLVLLRRRRAC
jgi:hypothetical protein